MLISLLNVYISLRIYEVLKTVHKIRIIIKYLY